MDKKNARLVCANKIRSLSQAIPDKDVANIIQTKSIIAGGAITSMLLGQPVNDFDIYFADQESAKKAADYFVDCFKKQKGERLKSEIKVIASPGRVKIFVKSSGLAVETNNPEAHDGYDVIGNPYDEEAIVDDGIGDRSLQEVRDALQNQADVEADQKQSSEHDRQPPLGRYRVVFLSSNAITLKDKVQLIVRFFGTPEEIISNFDFVHCTNFYTSWDRTLHLNQAALESTLAKKLKYVGSKYPLCSLIRLRKFIKREWTVTAGEILKIAVNLQKFNLSNAETLEDQLAGVDAHWFNKLIESLAKDQVSRQSDELDMNYLVELVDTLF